MSDDIRAKAQKVWDECEARGITDTTLAQFASHVLATEARLDVALRGALQSREEMREWLGSDEAARVIPAHMPVRGADDYHCSCGAFVSWEPAHVLAALIAAMPGGEA